MDTDDRVMRQQQLAQLYIDWAARTGRDPDDDEEFHRQAMAIVTGDADVESPLNRDE